jgi:hypothetical protein
VGAHNAFYRAGEEGSGREVGSQEAVGGKCDSNGACVMVPKRNREEGETGSRGGDRLAALRGSGGRRVNGEVEQSGGVIGDARRWRRSSRGRGRRGRAGLRRQIGQLGRFGRVGRSGPCRAHGQVGW